MSTENTQVAISASQQEIIQSLVLNGDLGKMAPQQRVEYYNSFCQSLGLNPLTQPFQLITFQGKVKMYATKDCTDQLRKIYNVSITDSRAETIANGDVYKVVVCAKDATGKTDIATGAISIKGLQGEALCNALMKCESKAKRRVTLSICGLGILDESEVESVQNTMQQTNVEVLDQDIESIDVTGIDDAIVNAVKDASTVKELGVIYKANEPLHQLPTFKELISKRRADIELLETQKKFGTDGK